MAASAWADLWSDALSWLQVASVFFHKLKEFMKRHKILWRRGRYLHGVWLAGIPRTTILLQRDQSFGEMLDQAYISVADVYVESDKIWCAYLIINCVSLRTFWTPLVHLLINDCSNKLEIIRWELKMCFVTFLTIDRWQSCWNLLLLSGTAHTTETLIYRYLPVTEQLKIIAQNQ